MKRAFALLAAAGALLASPAHAGTAFDACFPSTASSAGTVEMVRELEAPRDIHAFDPDVLVHKLRPETVEVLVVRLDTGPLVIIDQAKPHRLQAGARVRVTPHGLASCPAPLAGLDQRGF